MNIQKANWSTDGNNVRVTMPLQKVDVENRIVSGFATLDNVDTSNDIVLASASADAFNNFRGNIRLMHQPIPAGKLVDFREESYYDSKTQKFYNGIYVNVYVSKGAPEVWEMCLDGTLTGFSIGGQVTEAESQFVKDAGKVVRFIKAYDLIELSLVDSPANQLCDVVSITKAADGSTTVSGMVTEVVAENVFWCGTDKIAFTSQDEAKDCSACGNATENIGWFESDGGDKTEKVNSIVADFVKTDTVEGRLNNMADENVENTEVTAEATEDVVNVTPETDATTTTEAPAAEEEVTGDEVIAETDKLVDELEEVIESIDEVVEELEAEAPAAEDEAPVEAAAVDAEVADPNLSKMFAELTDSIQKALTDNADATEAALIKVNDQLSALGTVADKIDELAVKHAALEEKFNAVSEKVENVEKSFTSVEKSVGIKKSGDLGGSKEDKLEKSNKSIWGGRFFGSVENI